MLYAIQVGDDGPVKLGTAGDPVARLRVLQTAHDTRLHLRAAWPGERVDEQALHARFSADRLHGEWFGCTPELIAFVRDRAATMPPPAPRPVTRPDGGAAKRAAPSTERKPRPRAMRPSRPWWSRELRHPTWEQHGSLGPDERRDADQWIAVLCDLVPSLTVPQLLTWLELIAGADANGRLWIELHTVEERVLGARDPHAAARQLEELLHMRLPSEDSPWDRVPSAVLMDALTVHTSPGWAATSLGDAMVASGTTQVVLRRFGAGFGRQALPASFPVDGSFAVRHAWACEQLIAAERRLATLRADADAAQSRAAPSRFALATHP
jgi:hypothetical protein